ncbi:MAG TPA: nucleotidyltransferase domain-containing protein [Candidatus Nanoarchaeia archaeon]|nr:nucleotidyltransferase domain-containing protein [Candidatus Nanoarchaeia archaeon]
MVNQTINSLKKIIVPILKKNDVVKAGIFGSYARGEQKKSSDIDLLIKYGRKKKSLLDLVHLKYALEDKLNQKVDILTYKSINNLFKKEILDSEVKIL